MGRGQNQAASAPVPPRPHRPEWAYAHPEHREHAAWGAGESWGATPPRGLRPAGLADPETDELLGGPDGAGVAFGAPPETAKLPRQRAARIRIPGPRKEFVEAFDTPDAEPPEPDADAPADEPKPDGKGRALGGATAAAVVTVLAVVIAGQLAGGGKQSSAAGASSNASRAADDSASRSHARSTASASPSVSAAPLTYDQAMKRVYALDADLALSGEFRTIGGHQKAPGKGEVLKVRVDVEKGLPLDGELFAEAVHKTLNDDRSWGNGGTRTFERVSTGHADIVLTLASPGTTDKWCAKSGLDTSIDHVSCDSASTPRTMINAYRWAQGSETYTSTRILAYRQMVINHEVGHRLGHHHEVCPSNGGLAPVMMQQTKWLTLNGVTCKPNPWPYPKG